MFGRCLCNTARPKASSHTWTIRRLCTAVEERRFLIGNKGNVVTRKECGSHQDLHRGLVKMNSPTALPHICIAGESNAGKSSVINHLLAGGEWASSSSVAGKTRTIDLLKVNDRLVIADLPGLPSRDGQVTAMWQKTWEPLVFDYVGSCDNLRALVLVHDIRWQASPWVHQFLERVASKGVPVLLLLTKDDRIPLMLHDPTDRELENKLRRKETRRVREQLNFDGIHLHYSVNSELPSSRNARRRLLKLIESIVAAGSREECKVLLQGSSKWSEGTPTKHD